MVRPRPVPQRSATRSQAPKSRPPPSDLNLLLAALPAEEYRHLLPDLVPISPRLKTIVHKAGEPIEHVYFPCGGFFSVLTLLEDGKMVEVATIGREGMVGVMAALAGFRSSSVSMVQVEMDTAYRMTAEVFRREMSLRGPFFDLLAHYSQTLFALVMQGTACNAVHSVEQRLARWLLMAHDRVGHDEFPLTQEFVAMMLGTSRPTVTIVAGILQKAGLIEYRHGRITITDRQGLESASCECYRASRELFDARPSVRSLVSMA